MLRVRVSGLEKQQLENLAARAGLSMSDFMRVRALGAKPRIVKATPEEAAFIKGLAEMGKLGSNINQIAKALNTIVKRGELYHVPTDRIEQALYGVDMMTQYLMKQLGNNGNTWSDQGRG